MYTQLLLVSAGPARLGVPLHLFCAARGWDAFLISQKGGSGRRHAPLSLRLLAPGFLYFCAAPEGALRCVNRMLMANYAPALASFVRATPRNHPFSRPSALDYSKCETLGAVMINSAGELPWFCAQIEANYARLATTKASVHEKISNIASHQLVQPHFWFTVRKNLESHSKGYFLFSANRMSYEAWG